MSDFMKFQQTTLDEHAKCIDDIGDRLIQLQDESIKPYKDRIAELENELTAMRQSIIDICNTDYNAAYDVVGDILALIDKGEE